MSPDGSFRRSFLDPTVHRVCTDQSLKTVMEICVRCLQNIPTERPSVEDVLWNLQFAAQVQDGCRESQSSDGSPSGSPPQRPRLSVTMRWKQVPATQKLSCISTFWRKILMGFPVFAVHSWVEMENSLCSQEICCVQFKMLSSYMFIESILSIWSSKKNATQLCINICSRVNYLVNHLYLTRYLFITYVILYC